MLCSWWLIVVESPPREDDHDAATQKRYQIEPDAANTSSLCRA